MTLDQSFRFQHLVKARKGPVDGDGDGWVYDADKTKKRPATPAEMAAGAAMRARSKGGSGKGGSSNGSAAPKGRSSSRPEGAGKSIGRDHPKYKARKKEYDEKIATAKDDADLTRIVGKLQRDLILDDADYHATLDKIEQKATGKKPSDNRPPKRDDTKGPKSPEKPKAEAPKDADKDQKQPEEAEKPKSLTQRVKDRLVGRRNQPPTGPDSAPQAPQKPQNDDSSAKKAKQVAKMRDQIKNAKAEADMHRVLARLKDAKDLPQEDLHELLGEAAQRAFDIDAEKKKVAAESKAKRADTLMKRPVGAVPTWHPADDTPEVHEAHKAFFAKDENNIANAAPEGLWNFVLSDSRFEVTANDEAGNAANFWVTDTRNGERYMFKSTFFDGYNSPEKAEEALNDAVASDIMAEAGVKAVPAIHASAPGEYPGMMAQRDWMQLHAPKDAKIVDQTDYAVGILEDHPKQGKGQVSQAAYQLTDDAIERVKNGPNPDVGVEMVVLDYLINNSLDRHGRNFLAVEHKDGSLELGIVDHGMAFGTPPAATAGDPDADWELEFADFLAVYKAMRPEEDGSWGLQRLIAGVAGGDKAVLKKQLQSQINKFGQVDPHELYARATKKTLNKDQEKYLDEWLGEFDWRVEWMENNIDAMVDALAKEGGFK